MLQFYLGTQHDSERPMGNVASGELSFVIHAWLVGLQPEIEPVIRRSIQWIEKAIADDEDFGVDRNAHRKTLHWALAIGQWLDTGANVDGEWDLARKYEESRWCHEKRPWPVSEIVQFGLDDYMAFACQSDVQSTVYEAGREIYERFSGKAGPVSLSKTLKPREFGYALCLHRTGVQLFDDADLFRAGRKVLEANLQGVWLAGGQFIRAATWLKIVYGLTGKAFTPVQTVLKAYDNMPDVPMPEYLAVSAR